MAALNIPYTFSNGSPSNANQVNDNFNEVKNYVNTGVVRTDGAVKATGLSIADGAINNARLDYTSVPRMTVSTSPATGGKAGDVWIVV